MSTLYKLTTKCVPRVVQSMVGVKATSSRTGLERMQGAKEQALLNLYVNPYYNNHLKAMWLGVKKAFGSVDNTQLLKCIGRLQLPTWILRFPESITSRWKLGLKCSGEVIIMKKIEREIIQEDSLFPLLPALCFDPLSKRFNCTFVNVAMTVDHGMHITNHLLFVDDLKLLTLNGNALV